MVAAPMLECLLATLSAAASEVWRQQPIISTFTIRELGRLGKVAKRIYAKANEEIIAAAAWSADRN